MKYHLIRYHVLCSTIKLKYSHNILNDDIIADIFTKLLQSVKLTRFGYLMSVHDHLIN